jgi:hypothetical protein
MDGYSSNLLTINIQLILKVREIIFFAGKTHNGAFKGIFLGGRDLVDPSKIPKCPIMCFGPEKKIISHTFRIRGTLVFLCPYIYEREKERRERREMRG